MKKDIPFQPVEGVKVAIVRKVNEINQPEWFVYVLNLNDTAITNVFVTSKGYGLDQAQQVQKTSVLRHFFAEIPATEHVLVEPIMSDVFHLNNEYWVSYFIDNQLFDKKFIFLPESITEQNLIPIKSLGLEGVLHE